MITLTPLLCSGYEHWAKCPLGSYVVHESAVEHPMIRSYMMRTMIVMTTKLTQLTRQKAVVEVHTTVTVEGAPIATKPVETRQTLEIPAQEIQAKSDRVEQSVSAFGTEEEGYSVETASWSLQSAHTKEGDEELMIGGVPLQCHWMEQSMDVHGPPFMMKSWISEKIPGGVAKLMVQTGDDPQERGMLIAKSFRRIPPASKT